MDINPFITGGISLISGVLGWYLGRRDNARNRRHSAGVELVNAFSSELAEIRHRKNNDIVQILNDAFIKHQVAVDKFKLFLTDESALVAFNNAWYTYYADPKSGKKLLSQYWEGYDSTYDNGNARQTAINRIEAILAFAKNK